MVLGRNPGRPALKVSIKYFIWPEENEVHHVLDCSMGPYTYHKAYSRMYLGSENVSLGIKCLVIVRNNTAMFSGGFP